MNNRLRNRRSGPPGGTSRARCSCEKRDGRAGLYATKPRRLRSRVSSFEFLRNGRKRGAHCRRASLMLELVLSGLVLGMLLSAAIPTLGWIARARHLTRQRQVAILEVGNLMERMTLVDWDELTSERAAKFEISERLRDELGDPQLSVRV